GLAAGDFGYVTLDGISSQQAAVGDFNGDGRDDVFTVSYDGNGNYLSAVAAGDFNGDGILDAVASNWDAGTVNVMMGVGDGTGDLNDAGAFAAGASPTAVAVGDFNGDGRPDVAAANGSSNTVSVLLNEGDWPVRNVPSLRINDATVVEGNTGTVDAVFTVTRS